MDSVKGKARQSSSNAFLTAERPKTRGRTREISGASTANTANETAFDDFAFCVGMFGSLTSDQLFRFLMETPTRHFTYETIE